MKQRPILAAIAVPMVALASSLGCSDPPPDPSCSPWCTVVADCTATDFSLCMSDCSAELLNAQSTSSECADAVRRQNNCLSALTCEELDAWRQKVPPDSYPCTDADEGVRSVCFAERSELL